MNQKFDKLSVATALFKFYGDDKKTEDEKKEVPEDKKSDGSSDEVFENFEAFMEGQPDKVKSLFDEHIKGLRATITNTRAERDGFSKDLKKLREDLKEHPKLQSRIDELTKSLDSANAKADFYANAGSEGCINPKAAFALMLAEGLTDRRGDPDWDSLREAAPQLFKDPDTLETGAGEGTDKKLKKDKQKVPVTMNEMIRLQAGKR